VAGGRPDRSVAESVGAALVFAVATLATAWIGSAATTSGREWYEALDDPAFAPPEATFGVVWTVLYVAIAVAGWRAWRATSAPSPTVAWAVQMALNLAWTLVFFGSESLVGGLVVIAALIVAVAVDVWRSWRVDRVAGALLVPYLAWVCFAAALNVGYLALD
jgi:tryptophan-rich sensory protein